AAGQRAGQVGHQAAGDPEGAFAVHDRVGARLGVAARALQVAAEPEGAAIARLAGGATDAETRAQLAGEGFVRDHAAGFDHDLVDGLVELVDHFPDGLDPLRDVDHQQRVGTLVEADAAARRDESPRLVGADAAAHAALAVLGQQLGDVLGIAVVDRDVLGDHL